MKNQKYIITGAPGRGKTSIINELEKRNYYCVHENARKIISKQVITEGNILTWKNQIEFEKKIANLRVKEYLASPKNLICFFDRSAIDCIAYLKSKNLKLLPEIINSAKKTSFNNTVFYTPIWEEIYLKDNERKENLEQAKRIEISIKDIYKSEGYRLVKVPKLSIKKRADFILSKI